MKQTIDDLIRDLASENTNVADEAGLALRGRLDAVGKLLAAIPTLGRFGKLCAIEVIGSWPLEAARAAAKPSVGDVLIPLLRDESDTVRDWAAGILGWVGATEAVPELRAALARAKAAGVPPDWTERDSYRLALTRLGSRREIVPARVGALALNEDGHRRWRANDLPEVIEGLAAAGQVAYSVQGWHNGVGIHGPEYAIDLRGAWPEVVARNRAAALRAIQEWSPPSRTLVSLNWLDETDR